MPQPRERAPYSAIVDRPPLPPLPGGNRIIFWTIVNVEVWDITRPMPRMLLMPPQGQVRFPDVGNWAWHEYGNRVGFWRYQDEDQLRPIPAEWEQKTPLTPIRFRGQP